MKIKLYMCGKETALCENQVGLGYLKSNCSGANIEIVHSKKQLDDCDMIGLYVLAIDLKEAVEIMQSTNTPVIIGGAGTLWEGIKDYDFAHIVKGEGERALQKIIDGCREKTVKCEPVDMDSLKYPDLGECGHVVPIFPSRGCPFRCKYCSSSAFWETVRYNSAEYIIDYIQYLLIKYPHMKGVYFIDDLLIANMPRFHKLHDLWMKKSLHKRISASGYVRARLFTREIGLKLKEMNFSHVRFGAESGSDRILDFIGKNVTVEDNQKTIDIANEIGLRITAAFMYGFPTETDRERQMTIDFMKKNQGRVGDGGWYRFVAFPGTAFYDGHNPLRSNENFRGHKGELIRQGVKL